MNTEVKNHGILFIYRHPLKANAPALKTHIDSFSKYSKNKIWAINSKLGYPKYIEKLKFSAILLHYTVFPILLESNLSQFLQFLKSNPKTPKIAFFQDEHTLCKERFDFINDLDIDAIYTLLEPREHQHVYSAHTSCRNIMHTLTGYVDDSLIEAGEKFSLPIKKRTIDIGYRARKLPYYMGIGGLEKTMIAEKFLDYSDSTDLNLDINTGEQTRFNGDSWYKFIANCKAMIGVEAGVSIFDIDGSVRKESDAYIVKNPSASFSDIHKAVLANYENNIYYRTLSPRIFECAAFKTCMILFEGRYNDILKPKVHYIPLKKDFSNFQEVLNSFNDPQERKRLTDNAYQDLIESGKYSYQKFIEDFDQQLKNMGIKSKICKLDERRISYHLNIDKWIKTLVIIVKRIINKTHNKTKP